MPIRFVKRSDLNHMVLHLTLANTGAALELHWDRNRIQQLRTKLCTHSSVFSGLRCGPTDSEYKIYSLRMQKGVVVVDPET